MSVRVWAGDAGEGDFEAEGFDLADVVGDLAAGGGLPLVVIRAEILIAHARVGQQLVVDLQLGVADRDLGFGFAAFAGKAPVAGAFPGLGLAGRDGGLAGDGAQVLVAFLVPGTAGALAGLAGPVSARVSWAERRPQPGCDSACCSCS